MNANNIDKDVVNTIVEKFLLLKRRFQIQMN